MQNSLNWHETPLLCLIQTDRYLGIITKSKLCAIKVLINNTTKQI